MRGIRQLRQTGVLTTDLLLGADRLPGDYRCAYQEFFLALVRQRGFPLHTASLWNALHFGWSLELGGYLGRGVRLTMAESGPPIPVGAFVEVKLGANKIALAEVVYKEGRDPRVDALGLVEPAASGARLGRLRERAPADVCEGLVLDFAAFGDGLNDADPTVLARAQRKHLLTQDQHKVVEARYTPEDAGIDDLALFARYLLAQYGDELLATFLADFGAGVERADRWELLVRSLATVEELADDAPGLVSFGSYHLDADAYNADLLDRGDAPFGADALNGIAASVLRPPDSGSRNDHFAPSGPRPHAPTYLAAGALVREHLARSGLDEKERTLLAGPSYARLVLEANLTIARRLGEHGPGAGPGVHVRLDDEREGGGTWRTVRYDGDPPPEARFGPLMPLGLGFVEAELASARGASWASNGDGEAAARPEPAPEPAERDERGWRVPLRLIDLDHGDLPLAPEAFAMLPAGVAELIVELNDGVAQPIRRRRPLDRERRLVREMLYNPAFSPGTIVRYVVARGAPLLTVHAFPLPVPVEIEGRMLRWEFNERVFRQDLRLPPIELPKESRERSLSELIAEAFRRRGRPTEDRGLALRADEVVCALLGAEHDLALSGPILLRLQAGDYEYRAGEYVWFPRLSPRTSPRERVRLREARKESETRLRRILAPRMVQMAVRTYTRGRKGRKHASYDEALTRYHMRGLLPERLLENQTWVKPYPLG